MHNEAKKSITFIDYEYAAYNHQAFDIGNHFNEFAGKENFLLACAFEINVLLSGLSTVDYSLYPDLDFQRTWIKMYLVQFNGTSEVSKNEVHQLLLLVNKFSLASHFLWTTWALVQAEHSTIDFDYLEWVFWSKT